MRLLHPCNLLLLVFIRMTSKITEVWSSLRNLILLKKHRVLIGSKTSLCHFKITANILFISCGLVSGHQYFGTPIQCVQYKRGDDATIREDVLNTFCFITSTYTPIDSAGDSTVLGSLPGQVRRHSYYQWIPFVLFLQAVLFMLPHGLWFYVENKFLKRCLQSLPADKLVNSTTQHPTIPRLARYLYERLNTLQIYFWGCFTTEILNLINVIANFLFTDLLLGGYFLNFGIKIIKNQLETGDLQLENVFPKLTKCEFRKYGPSGTIQNHDALCLMALNVINEKIYTFLWFWFIFLGVLSAGSLFVKFTVWLIMLCKPKNAILRKCYSAKANRQQMDSLVHKLTISDWMFLKQLKQNIASSTYNELVHELCNLIHPRKTIDLS